MQLIFFNASKRNQEICIIDNIVFDFVILCIPYIWRQNYKSPRRWRRDVWVFDIIIFPCCFSILFAVVYLTKKWFFLLLAMMMFVGFGEEISWGQRIFGFSTPDSLAEINVQTEFNLHNIDMFSSTGFNYKPKMGFAKLLTVNFLYKLFWLGYCVLLPIAYLCIRPVYLLSQKLRLPIPPLLIGFFFPFNWIIFRMSYSFLLPANKTFQYYDTIGEIRECLSAFIFMVLGFYFFYEENSSKAAVDNNQK